MQLQRHMDQQQHQQQQQQQQQPSVAAHHESTPPPAHPNMLSREPVAVQGGSSGSLSGLYFAESQRTMSQRSGSDTGEYQAEPGESVGGPNQKPMPHSKSQRHQADRRERRDSARNTKSDKYTLWDRKSSTGASPANSIGPSQ
eukprot:CAMPEP_0196581578 /NCGR_PEP_ID=MMETSP1081-20130531/34396_1 /TAXON_ID=36882 /ORGANISM="Pyramimonas amylifera, Strain CCMP720" /LENGTH=142 /DNA_ID=CAMNT_0041901859 /DNA_START=1 /DNA_END=429 /DNA_ORIENTATION=-